MPEETSAARDLERLDVEQLGDLIRERRGALSLRQAAADAGVSFSTFTRVESGHHPDLVTFTKLCAWLGLPPSRFFMPVTERRVSPLEEAISHLKTDPALSSADASRIANVMKDLYTALAKTAVPQNKLVACHLRASAVLRPGVAPRLGSILEDLHTELSRRVEAGEL